MWGNVAGKERKQEIVHIRLPDGMREELKATSKKNGRTMNAEVVARLEAFAAIDAERANMKHRMAEAERALNKAIKKTHILQAAINDELTRSAEGKPSLVEGYNSIILEMVDVVKSEDFSERLAGLLIEHVPEARHIIAEAVLAGYVDRRVEKAIQSGEYDEMRNQLADDAE